MNKSKLLPRKHLLLMLCLLGLTACNNPSEQVNLSDFVRLNANGSLYAGNGDYQTEPWHCVHDRYTDLTWEVKSTQTGLRYHSNTYSWYKTKEVKKRFDPGFEDGGKCAGSKCDTKAYIEAINREGLCGFNDWRLPKRLVLGSIVDRRFSNPPPTIDKKFFPHTQAAEYWTSDTYGLYDAGAWGWSFVFGYDRVDSRSRRRRRRRRRPHPHYPRPK